MKSNEEIIYCTNCGAVNNLSAIVCEECKENIRKKHYSFFTFLANNTKDKLKGDTQDFVLKKIENFLISHIYGTILTITIVTGAIAFAVPDNPYIKKVSTNDVVSEMVKSPEPVKEKVFIDLAEEGMSLSTLEMNYQQAVESERFDVSEDTPSVAECLAQNAPAGFSYNTLHDLKQYGVFSLVKQASGDTGQETMGTMGSMFRANEDLTFELSKQLYNDGYEVAESTRECIGYFDGRVYDFTDWDNLPAPDIRFYYEMVYVKLNGKWYIAQDKLVR